jgi:porphobilinogen synthase
MAETPFARFRRLRRTPALRDLVREIRLTPDRLVQPLFLRPGRRVREPIPSLPGQEWVSADELVRDAERLAGLGVGGVLLFGLPGEKDALGNAAWRGDGVVQAGIRAVREAGVELAVLADVCL